MRGTRVIVGAVGLVLLGVVAGIASCGGDDGADGETEGTETGGGDAIEVVVSNNTSAIAPLRGIRCELVDDTQLKATGVVESNGDTAHYVDIDVRFVDSEGVRVEIASDSVSDLLVGESARWEATTYADGAGDVRTCEVTATVS